MSLNKPIAYGGMDWKRHTIHCRLSETLAMSKELDGLQSALDGSIVQWINYSDSAVNQWFVDALKPYDLIRAQVIHVSVLLREMRKKESQK